MTAYLIAISLIAMALSVHEIFHMMVAYCLGMEIESVYIGLPIWPKREVSIKGVNFVVSPWLLLVGVKIKTKSYWGAPAWKRTLVSVYGPVANWTLGMLGAFATFGLVAGLEVSQEMCSASLLATLQTIAGKVPLSDISGPLEVVQYSALAIGIDRRLGPVFALMLINFGIGALNLMPIPALDGGFVFWGNFCAVFFGDSPKSLQVVQVISEICVGLLLTGLAILTISEIGDILTML